MNQLCQPGLGNFNGILKFGMCHYLYDNYVFNSMGIMFSQYLKVALNCAQLMKNHWNRFCVKEQHDKHTFRILHVSLNFIIHEVVIKTWKTVFIFRTCTCQTYALIHIYYSYIHIYIIYVYIHTHTHTHIYISVCVHMLSHFSHVQLFMTLWFTVL